MKTIINYVMIAMISFAIVGSSTLVAQEWSKEQKEVWQSVQDGWAKWAKGDMSGFDGVHDSYLGWNNDRPMPMSKEKWMMMSEKYNESMTVNWYDMEPVRIVIEDDIALVYYYFAYNMQFEMGEEKEVEEGTGRNLDIMKKEGGVWKLLGDMTYVDEDDD